MPVPKNGWQIYKIDGFGPTNREAYPLVRPFFLYTDARLLSQKPEIGAFLNFFLTHVDEEIRPLGYTSLSQDRLNNTKQTLLTLLRGNIPAANSDKTPTAINASIPSTLNFCIRQAGYH